jgi:hypothetical protein
LDEVDSVAMVDHPPLLLPHHFASDVFLATLSGQDNSHFSPINFYRLFELKLNIPAFMGSTNIVAVESQVLRNVVYFENEHQKPGSGPASLVARVKHHSASKSSDIEPTEALFVLLNTWLVNNLGSKELTVYMALMNHTTRQMPGHQGALDNTPTTLSASALSLPLDSTSAKNELLHGKRSILLNTARPFTHTLRNGYSYISCIDSLSCLLASGVKFEPLIGRSSPFLRDNDGHLSIRFNADTPRGAEIQANAEARLGPVAFSPLQRIPNIVLLAFLWSDSFEPNATKQNRGSVHAFLLTFGFSEDDPHSGATTVLLALGPGDSPTDDVEALLQQELNKLMTPAGADNLFYVGECGAVCRVFVQLYSLQEDRMERQSVTRSLGGTSNSTARWGWLADLFAQQTFLPSCSTCYQGLLANVDTTVYRTACGCCANWEMDGLTYAPPPNYPLERLPENSPVLFFRPLTFEGMHLACNEAFLKVSTGVWKVSSAEIFLKTEGVNNQFASLVLVAASNCLKLRNMDPESATYHSHLQLSQSFNSPFPVVQPAKPSTWCYPGVSLIDHIDVVMHLLFLGIVSTVLKETYFPWLKAHRLMTDLSQMTRKALTELDTMSLVWCKALMINETGSLGSAVSENYLAYCRLGKWLFGSSEVLRARDLVYSDPDRPLPQYTITQIKAWYQAREIPVPSLDSDELRAQFILANSQETGPPPIPEKGEAGIPREVANDLINSMVALVAHVMIEGKVGEADIWAVERHVKLFLSTYENFDEFRRKKNASRNDDAGPLRRKKKAAWISHMNFASLLNLPGVMTRYGSLRALWEGDRKGEGGLPPLKSKIKRGCSGNWSTNAAQAVIRETALERALESAAYAAGSNSSESSVKALQDAAKTVIGHSITRGYKNFKIYTSEYQAARALTSGSPVSLVVLKSDASFGMVVKGGSLLVVTVNAEEGPVIVGGAAYHTFVNGGLKELLDPSLHVEKYALLLPQFSNGPFTGRHHLITSNWEELDGNATVVRYQMEAAFY